VDAASGRKYGVGLVGSERRKTQWQEWKALVLLLLFLVSLRGVEAESLGDGGCPGLAGEGLLFKTAATRTIWGTFILDGSQNPSKWLEQGSV
jgi:hypothetical protein